MVVSKLGSNLTWVNSLGQGQVQTMLKIQTYSNSSNFNDVVLKVKK